MTPEQWLQLVIDRAPELRSAGVDSISIDGASVHLLPVEPEPPAVTAMPASADQQFLSPLDDPETFGGVLPGYTFPVSPPGALE